VVHFNGERITEARVAQMADEAERRARERYRLASSNGERLDKPSRSSM
jgi:hypothetical protein